MARSAAKKLTIALNRGRVLAEALPVLARVGITPAEPIEGSRKLVFETSAGDARLVVVRGDDVPTYVEYGAADLGITGKDTLLEHASADYYERLDLGIARCRIMTAAPIGAPEVRGPLRVATKLVRTATQHFATRGRQAQIIRLSGAIEIAPLMGLADCIVDIVDTGSTLEANGLEARELVAEVTTRVIVNRASSKTRFDEIEALLERLREAASSRPKGR